MHEKKYTTRTREHHSLTGTAYGDMMMYCTEHQRKNAVPQASKCAVDDMSRYELFEHTADTGIEASGNTLAEAYAAAAQGMLSILTDPDKVRDTGSRRVEINADDPQSLLFEWLNELLYEFEVHGFLLRNCEITEFSDTRLVAECRGETYDPSRHELYTGIKSATYHEMDVDRDNNRVRVIFDV